MLDLSRYNRIMVTNYKQHLPEGLRINDLGSRKNLYESDLILIHAVGDFYEVHKDRYGSDKDTMIEIKEADFAKMLLLGNGVEVNGKFRFQK